MALIYSDLSELCGHPAKLDLLRTHKKARIAQTTKPDKIRREHFFSHAQQNHVNHAPGVKVFNHLMDRAHRRTRAAGITRLDVF